MKVAIDPGHGMGNRTAGVFDPGAIYAGVREADVVLEYGIALQAALAERNVPTWLSRRTNVSPMPLVLRVLQAKALGCTVMVSLHCNAATSETATGTETCFRIPHGRLAADVQAAVVGVLGLRDRGVKVRDELAVLRGEVPAVLVELGFLSNPHDRAVLTDPANPARVAAALAAVLNPGD